MSVLIIGMVEREAIKAAIARARERPIPLEHIAAARVEEGREGVKLSDRRPDAPRRLTSQQVIIPNGYRLAISWEEQPSGMCQHISVSCIGRADRVVPNEPAMAMIAQACGMQWPPGERSRIWLEEFEELDHTGTAINLVEVVMPGQIGHA